ncbi:MAG: hypothetical protein WBX02_15675, partial [Terriglobales bacterium]
PYSLAPLNRTAHDTNSHAILFGMNALLLHRNTGSLQNCSSQYYFMASERVRSLLPYDLQFF